jgi:hypothetical protein
MIFNRLMNGSIPSQQYEINSLLISAGDLTLEEIKASIIRNFVDKEIMTLLLL